MSVRAGTYLTPCHLATAMNPEKKNLRQVLYAFVFPGNPTSLRPLSHGRRLMASILRLLFGFPPGGPPGRDPRVLEQQVAVLCVTV
jgi:hypothetical protein